MSETKNIDYAYEFLNSKQQEIASKVETLLKGLTVNEAKELLRCVSKSIENTKIN